VGHAEPGLGHVPRLGIADELGNHRIYLHLHPLYLASPEAVILFEILLNATSLFNHGNVRLPQAIDRVLRFFLVTPEMHRVHHSVIIRETNSNFGFNLPWWDRLFGTYRSAPAAGHEGMTIGLSHIRDPKRLTLPWLLILPFSEKPGRYPIS
jgi:sterol desaturase/sphingolipid hydroxylase (fatty acid hydroxylase superfamily)